jgi:hypothetical protein
LKIFVTSYQEIISVADIAYSAAGLDQKVAIDSMEVTFLGWPVHFHGSRLQKLLE